MTFYHLSSNVTPFFVVPRASLKNDEEAPLCPAIHVCCHALFVPLCGDGICHFNCKCIMRYIIGSRERHFRESPFLRAHHNCFWEITTWEGLNGSIWLNNSKECFLGSRRQWKGSDNYCELCYLAILMSITNITFWLIALRWCPREHILGKEVFPQYRAMSSIFLIWEGHTYEHVSTEIFYRERKAGFALLRKATY